MSDQNGRMEVVVMSAGDPNQKWQVSASGGTAGVATAKNSYFDLANRINAVSIESSGVDLTVGTPHPLFAFNPGLLWWCRTGSHD